MCKCDKRLHLVCGCKFKKRGFDFFGNSVFDIIMCDYHNSGDRIIKHVHLQPFDSLRITINVSPESIGNIKDLRIKYGRYKASLGS